MHSGCWSPSQPCSSLLGKCSKMCYLQPVTLHSNQSQAGCS